MEDLIVFNDAIENQSDSEDEEDDAESTSANRIWVLKSKETHRRFVYNTLPYDSKLKDFIEKNKKKRQK